VCSIPPSLSARKKLLRSGHLHTPELQVVSTCFADITSTGFQTSLAICFSRFSGMGYQDELAEAFAVDR
jgi:hypothetical protein